VARLAGRRQVDPQFFPVRAGFTMKKKAGRREWLRVRLEETDTGLVARKFAAQGSGILTSMVEGDGLVELVENVSQIQEGDPLPFLPFNEVLT
ncbi:MAG: molybdopterin molybdenumtransferase MoeA, partial [Magnetospiraceae bacterium]